MQTTRRLGTVFAVAGLLLAVTETTEARVQYRVVFMKHYTQVAAANKITCYVCHEKKDGKPNLKKHNLYGQAIGKNLKTKNEKNINLIKSALTETEKVVYNPEDGTTYGDILKGGRLPFPEE